MTTTLLTALRALPAFSLEPTPETPADRAERLVDVAQVTWQAATTRPGGYSQLQWSLILAALAWHETRLAKYVQDGKCSSGPVGMRCDNGKARGPWQLHRSACRELWATKSGSSEALTAGANCASRQLAYAHHRCKRRAATPLQGAFSGYAGASCTMRWAAKRERTALGLIARWR